MDDREIERHIRDGLVDAWAVMDTAQRDATESKRTEYLARIAVGLYSIAKFDKDAAYRLGLERPSDIPLSSFKDMVQWITWMQDCEIFLQRINDCIVADARNVFTDKYPEFFKPYKALSESEIREASVKAGTEIAKGIKRGYDDMTTPDDETMRRLEASQERVRKIRMVR